MERQTASAQGAAVVLARQSSDCAIFAGIPVREGIPGAAVTHS
jgi:hypothetical protein